MDAPTHDEEVARVQEHVPEPAVYRNALRSRQLDVDALKVIRRLNRGGFESYLVGGGVRDLLLERSPKDFDVATNAKPNEVRRLFRNCRVIGRRFRLAHVLFGGGKIIEVATFRRDPHQTFRIMPARTVDGVEDGAPVCLEPNERDTGGGDDLLIKSDNVFGLPHEDAIRRDFTINGLFYDIEDNAVIDYVGGMADLELGVVRTIGEPNMRFLEDPIRMLRAIKFAGRLGMQIEEETYDAIVAQREEILRSAKPRIGEELLRLMRGHAAAPSYELAWETGVLAVVLPELATYLDDTRDAGGLHFQRLAALDHLMEEGEPVSDAVLMAALLLDPLEEALEESVDLNGDFQDFMEPIVQRISLPRRQVERIKLLWIAQYKMRRGRLGSLPRREFFGEALQLFKVDRETRGLPVPDWEADPQPTPTRRRRRRRRRKD